MADRDRPRPGGRKKTRGRAKPPAPHAAVSPPEVAPPPPPAEVYQRPPGQSVADRIEELGGLDWICEQIQDHVTHRAMARRIGCAIYSIQLWISATPERAERVAAARRASADTADDLALETLRDEAVEPSRAREIAAHLRWRAKARAPAVYGDRTTVDATVSVTDRPIAELRREAEAIAARLGVPLPTGGDGADEG